MNPARCGERPVRPLLRAPTGVGAVAAASWTVALAALAALQRRRIQRACARRPALVAGVVATAAWVAAGHTLHIAGLWYVGLPLVGWLRWDAAALVGGAALLVAAAAPRVAAATVLALAASNLASYAPRFALQGDIDKLKPYMDAAPPEELVRELPGGLDAEATAALLEACFARAEVWTHITTVRRARGSPM